MKKFRRGEPLPLCLAESYCASIVDDRAVPRCVKIYSQGIVDISEGSHVVSTIPRASRQRHGVILSSSGFSDCLDMEHALMSIGVGDSRGDSNGSMVERYRL